MKRNETISLQRTWRHAGERAACTNVLAVKTFCPDENDEFNAKPTVNFNSIFLSLIFAWSLFLCLLYWWPFNFYLHFSFMVTWPARTITPAEPRCSPSSLQCCSHYTPSRTHTVALNRKTSATLSILATTFRAFSRFVSTNITDRTNLEENYNNFPLIK